MTQSIPEPVIYEDWPMSDTDAILEREKYMRTLGWCCTDMETKYCIHENDTMLMKSVIRMTFRRID